MMLSRASAERRHLRQLAKGDLAQMRLELERLRDLECVATEILDAWDGGAGELALFGPPERIERVRRCLCALREAMRQDEGTAC